jgi:hypothetical protein
MSSTDGIFHFLDLPMCYDYMVIPYKDTDTDNGVTVYDLIKIQKHILGVENLDSPYKIIAADANNSGVVSTSDLIDIRKVILHNTEAFPNNTSWRFVTTEYVFENPQDPLKEKWPKMDMVDMLSSDANLSFMGIKTGDIDNSADPVNGLDQSDAENRLANTFYLEVEDRLVEAGAYVTVPFSAVDLKNIAGYQFTLNFNPDLATFIDVEPGNLDDLTMENFAFFLEEGAITTVWNGQAPALDQPVFNLTLKAQRSIRLSELFSVNSRITNAEAYSQALEPMNVDLRFKAEDGSPDAGLAYELYQNTPNPFAQQTIISFQLPKNTFASVTVYDLSGRVIKRYEGDFQKGYNEISVSRSDFDASGVLYYQLKTAEFSATKKMTILK